MPRPTEPTDKPIDVSDADVLYLKVPNNAKFRTIGTMLRHLEESLRTSDNATPKRVVLDMRSVAFCSATAVTIVAAALEDIYVRGLMSGGQVWLPNSPLAKQYLQRMNFFREIRVDIAEDFERREPANFYPVTHVPDEAASRQITRELVTPCQKNLDLDPQAVSALKTCVGELMENVFYHANSPIEALVSAQTYKKRGRIELVIADTGIGIKSALAAVPEYAARASTDCDAIRLALKKNVTTTGDRRRGIGLWVASELVRLNGGELLILSNEGGIHIEGDRDADVQQHYWPGTLIAIEFRLDRPINVKTVYDRGDFPDVDSYDF